MSCQECRGYSVPRCPCCQAGELPELPEICQDVVAKINASPGMGPEEVQEEVYAAARQIAECDEDFDGLVDRMLGMVQ